MRRIAVALAVALAALAAGPAALAHVIVLPASLTQGEEATLELDVPNERDAAMTELRLEAPNGVEILEARPSDGWQTALSEGNTAIWTGSLDGRASTRFAFVAEATGDPGPVTFTAEQRFADGATVRWVPSVLVLPGEGGGIGTGSIAAGATVAGAVLVASLLVLRRLRRAAGD